MLEEIVELLWDTLFEMSNYCFQQELAPAHKEKEVQQWLIPISLRLMSGHLGALISIH